jgi:prephenate dehydratase
MDSNNFIAFQGIRAAHSEAACRKAYPDKQTLPLPSFEDVFDAVRNGQAALGMVPIENSQTGRVAEIHSLLPQLDLYIVGEYIQSIEHHLLVTPAATPETIQHVYSHPQAILQCRQNLRQLKLQMHDYADTALAAHDVAEWRDPTKAALASELAAQEYNLKIIKRNMEDSPDNKTLFVCLAAEPIDPDPAEGRVVTSVIFTTRHIPAALYKALGGFATNKINLLKLESYIPPHITRTAHFFVTFLGHQKERAVQLALEELAFFCVQVKILGSYLADPIRFK